MDSNVLIVLTNCPDAATAQRIAAALVQNAWAACVNQLAPVLSTYRWQGKVETQTEIPLLIKTTAQCYAQVEAAICDLHPYSVPEIVAWPLSAGLPSYLRWVQDETQAPRLA